jgi:hypothetical protein
MRIAPLVIILTLVLAAPAAAARNRKMRKRGTYKIVCSIHAPDMAMTLRVN